MDKQLSDNQSSKTSKKKIISYIIFILFNIIVLSLIFYWNNLARVSVEEELLKRDNYTKECDIIEDQTICVAPDVSVGDPYIIEKMVFNTSLLLLTFIIFVEMVIVFISFIIIKRREKKKEKDKIVLMIILLLVLLFLIYLMFTNNIFR